MVTINELKKQKEFKENAVKTLNEKINQNKKLKLLLKRISALFIPIKMKKLKLKLLTMK